MEAAVRLLERKLDVVAELDLGPDVAQRHHFVAQRHPIAFVRRDVVVVAPFVDTHLLADDLHHRHGGALRSAAEHMLWIDSAASWPWATAQMMFFGPKAASPPKNTFGWVDAMVLGSTLGMSHLSNSMPMSRSIQGEAFSWPTATNTSTHSTVWPGPPDGTRLRRPLASYSAFTFWKGTPGSL